ncbi:MAG: RsmD family RNA methyltransferase [Bacteroidota bacterium]|nr:RsmD family RNA methyltransferase [Bacteroidota bacterium]MDP3144823.1 RsmD family RNA methyltransferase [Bacteroidota bacterium]MDP3557806.1 RsmD family RNA methyltransferase [Bacteroidota bacterium]
MRIINGTHQGRVIKVPKGLPVRPTTDFAKEGLFNILNNKINYDETKVLDLFSGTGHISLEFASRGSTDILSVDGNFKCVGFLRATSKELKFNIDAVKSDVFDFLKHCNQKFDLIFADPPYELENIPTIHQLVFDKQLLNPNGWLIIEHGPRTNLEALSNFVQKRSYGNVNFSFFANK